MKNALLNAAMYAAIPYGIRINAWKLSDKLSMSNADLTEAIKPYMQPLTEFYEIGEDVAMGEANDQFALFVAFGEWFASYMREEGKVPDQETAIQRISDLTFAVFTNQISNDQDVILKRRLAVEVKEYADE